MINFDYAKISNPVLSSDKKHVRDPAVLVHNDLAYLFFSYYDPKKKTWHIGMTTTEDFVHFNKISLISPEGYASPGNVIKVGEKWVICYQQYRDFPHFLCLSYSDNLVTWSSPINFFNTGKENKWNLDKRVIDPYIVEWEETYYCYYTGSTRWFKHPEIKGEHNLIGIAISNNLKDGRDLSPDSPLIGIDFSWEETGGVENNCVIRYNDRWFMLYSASMIHQKIAYAISDNLIKWKKKGLCNVPVFEASANSYGAPFIIEELSRSGNYYMIYQGEASDGHMSFLLLKSDDLVNWH